jgi:subtilase family serine protease
VTFVASTGDFGSADPEYPAFSPNVVAVGGTSLYLKTDNTYNNETAWGYNTAGGSGAFIGGGGGVSQFESEPAFQAGVQASGNRSTPDVSFLADPGTGAWISDTYNLSSDASWEIVGGTSLAAPSWAGLIAVANQGRAAAGSGTFGSTGTSSAQQALYNLPGGSYTDVTTGANGDFSAGAGYDVVTGLGSPVANVLVPSLVSYAGAVNTPTTPPTYLAGYVPTASSGDGSGGGSANFAVFSLMTTSSQAAATSNAPHMAAPTTDTLANVSANPLSHGAVIPTTISGRTAAIDFGSTLESVNLANNLGNDHFGWAGDEVSRAVYVGPADGSAANRAVIANLQVVDGATRTTDTWAGSRSIREVDGDGLQAGWWLDEFNADDADLMAVGGEAA